MALCEEGGYAYSGRVKDAASLSEKIETGRYRNWEEIDDLFACSIVIPTLDEEPEVIKRLHDAFTEVECKRRGDTQKDPSVFRFDATRFIGRLRPESLPNAASELLKIRFEVQVRSAFEHAWSVTTHALSYKSAQVDWRHLRLAAQLRAAVEQLDQVVLGFEKSASFISDQAWPAVQARQRIWRYFSDLVEQGHLPTEVTPRSWGRFSENLFALISSSSDKRIYDPVDYVERALLMIEREVKQTTAQSFPRSVSLLQFCTGSLVRHGLFTSVPHRYVPLVTFELASLFPETTKLGTGFHIGQ